MLAFMAILIISLLYCAWRDLKECDKSTEKQLNKPKEADVYSEINTAYSTYRLVLWLVDDGLRLNDDGTTEWIKRSNPTNNRLRALPRNVFQELTEEAGTIHKSSRYQIWDKKSNIYTIFREYSPQEWIERHPWILEQGAVPIISGGIINGIFLYELGELKKHCEERGAVFEPGISNEKLLYEIEMFEKRLMGQDRQVVK